MIVDLSLGAPAGADDASTTTTPSPQEPLPGMSDDGTEVTAGLGGFLVVFALGLAVWFLGRDLTRRLRRMSRAEEQRIAAQRAEDTGHAKDAKDAKDAKGSGTQGTQGRNPDSGEER